MKAKRIIMLGLLLNVLVAQNPITVSNVPGVSADYNDLQTALDAASDSSTIYVYASSSSYGDISITKPTFLYGAGMFPDTPGPVTTKLGNVTFTTLQTDSSHGSILSGFEISAVITLSTGLRDITIERNNGKRIELDQNVNISIINNRLINNTYTIIISLSNSINTSIINNIIYNDSNQSSNVWIITGGNALVINNYIYYKDNESYAIEEVFSGSDYTIENNIIIMDGYVTWGNISNSLFYNNLSDSELTLGSNGNGGSGHIVGTPVYTSTTFGDPDYYALTWGSPGTEAGTDGTDVGIQGGIYKFSNAYMPPLPYVQELDLPTVVPLNGSVNVKITGKSHN